MKSTPRPTHISFRTSTDALTEWLTVEPTDGPTQRPTKNLTEEPTRRLSNEPTIDPTRRPTDGPTDYLTKWPANDPTTMKSEIHTNYNISLLDMHWNKYLVNIILNIN